MEETKKWWQSSAVWGGLVAVVAGLLGVFGYTLGDEDQMAITAILASVAGSIGGGIAVYKRIKATKVIK